MLRAVRPLLVCAAAAAVLVGGALIPVTAAVAAGSRQVTPEDLLPDLQLDPLEDFRVQIIDGRRVLRFTAGVANRGDGPLELAATRSSTSAPDLAVVQHVYQPNGKYESVQSAAVLRFSVENRHRWNLADAAEYTMTVVGDETPRVKRTVELCFTDESRLAGTAEAMGYACLDGRPDGRSATEGLSVGWSNVYRSYERTQWVDLTGLSLPGQYCVAARADPRQLLLEKNKDNNSATALVDVQSNGVSVVAANC